ncbi:MAG: hypothetical protein KF712_12580 [Akkermansiaceae bacterium]|nr:hypothetical protein [Akkermansiaceae bacterium]
MATIPLLTLQWIGVMALRKTERTGAWWCMLAGTVSYTLSMAFHLTIYIWQGLWGHEMLMMVYHTTSYVRSGSALLFMIGFAIHAVRLSRMRGRIEELEMMNLAQATELERLRNR